MTSEEKFKLKSAIDNEVKKLSNDIADMQTAIYPTKGEGISDKVAHISFKQEQNIHLQRYTQATKRLNRLKQAYLKVDTPEYGICQECGEEIPMQRLLLMPESLYCVSCMNESGL